VAIILSMGAILAAHPAAAQTPEELAQARAAFGEGVELTEQERWPDAAERFRAVIAVRATGQVKYNLGLALAHTSELVEAAALLREAADDRELARATRRQARELLGEIEPRIGELRVVLRGDEAGLALTLDGERLGLERVNVPFPANPGTHRVVVTRGSREIDAQSVEVPEGGEAVVTLRTVAPPPAVVDDEVILALDEEPVTGGRSVAVEWWFWTIIGAVVVAGVGITIGVVVSNDGEVQPVFGNLDPGVLEVMP
jgi:hypothetical protein